MHFLLKCHGHKTQLVSLSLTQLTLFYYFGILQELVFWVFAPGVRLENS